MKPQSSRIIEIDALRGFALIGILIVNLYSFNMYYGYMANFYSKFTGLDNEIFWIVMHFFGGKFMFIFAFLFGYGAYIQFDKYSDYIKSRNFWYRRMVILFCIGILHIILLSFGDILAAYALLGMSIPFFIRKKNWFLLIVFFLLQLIPAIEYALQTLLNYPNLFKGSKYSIEEYLNINQSTNIFDIIQLRLNDFFTFRNEKIIQYMPKELSLFLLGIISARINLIQKSYSKKGIFFSLFGLLIAFIFYLKGEEIWALFHYKKSIFRAFSLDVTYMIKEIIHGLSYIIAFFVLWNWNLFRKTISFLQYSGKMALTNYLMQSLICFFIFSGFGLRLYGQLSPTQLMFLAFGILIFQWIFSFLWLKKYRFGPMEWIWRQLSYKERISIKR